MTLLPSHLAQSTWGEKCAFYLDTVADSINHHIHIRGQPLLHTLLRHRLVSTFSDVRDYISSLLRALGLEDTILADEKTITWAILSTTLVAFLVLVTMSSWRGPFFDFFRRSPTYNPVPAPHVSDQDYSYISDGDLDAPPGSRAPYGAGGRGAPIGGDGGGGGNGGGDDSSPDILLLKHHKYKYTLEFPAYAIDDGALRVGHLRQRAAEVTRTADPDRVKLLYKGKLLDEDSLPCKAEGLKQESEVLCVVSEVQPGEVSDPEMMDGGRNVVRGDDGGGGGKKTGKNKKKNGKGKKNKNQKGATTDNIASPVPTPLQQPPPQPPQQQQQPKPQAISTSASNLPAPAPNLKNFNTPLEQANALTGYFRSELLPPCNAYAAGTPTDTRIRDFEHKKLSETILAQVLLKADGIDSTGDPDARNARKALVKEAQEALNKLDAALNG